MFINSSSSDSNWIKKDIENESSGRSGFRHYIHETYYSLGQYVRPNGRKITQAKKIYRKILKCYEKFQKTINLPDDEVSHLKEKIIKLKNKIDDLLNIKLLQDPAPKEKTNEYQNLPTPLITKASHPSKSQEFMTSITNAIDSKDEKKAIELIESLESDPSKLSIYDTPQIWEMAIDTNMKELIEVLKIDQRTKVSFSLAVEMNYQKIALFLMNKENIHEKDPYGITPLHWAAQQEFVEIIPLMIELGADINAETLKGETPLFYTSNKRTLTFLIENGANINHINKKGNSCLDQAIDSSTPLTIFFIKQGCDYNLKNKNGNTPFHLLLSNFFNGGSSDPLKLIMQKGCDPTTRNWLNRSPFHILLSNHYDPKRHAEDLVYWKELVLTLMELDKENINKPDKDGVSPLFTALKNHYVEMALEIYARGGDFFEKSTEVWTSSLRLVISSGVKEIFKLLIDKEEDKLLKFLGKPLFLEGLITCGMEEEALSFFEKEFDDVFLTFSGYIKGQSLLLTAIEYRHTQLAHRMLDKNFNFDGKSEKSVTPLHLAIRTNQIDLAKRLIKMGADVSAIDYDGDTPLHDAFLYKQPGIVRSLIKRDAFEPNLYGLRRYTLAKSLGVDVSAYVNSSEQLLSDKIEWLKLISNAWSISEKTRVPPFSFEHQGGFEPLYQMHLLKYLERYAQNYPNAEIFSKIKEEFAQYTVTEKLTAQEIFEKVNKKETLIFQAGPKEHVISIMFRVVGEDYYMLIANRGKGRKKSPIQAYLIRDDFTEDHAKEILKLNSRLSGDWENFVYDQLPSLITDKYPLFQEYVNNLKGRTQQIGNCWQVSLKAMVRGMLICHACQGLDKESLNSISLSGAIYGTINPYKKFTEYLRFEMLKDYLKFRITPHQNNSDGAYDLELLQKIASKVFHRRPWKFPVNLEEIKSLLKDYEKAFDVIILS